MTVRIIGAGMAGLLAGAMFRGEAQIYEAAPSLPNNHHALLRFRSNEISHYLNIPFQEVDVLKVVREYVNPVAQAIAYSRKATGTASLRSSVTAEGKIERRYIAPDDFIHQMAAHQHNPIVYDSPVMDKSWFEEPAAKGTPVISTMPMPRLMDVLGYPHRSSFGYRHGWVINASLNIESRACATIYYPDPAMPIIRATLTNALLQIELIEDYERNDTMWPIEQVMSLVMADFGLDSISYEMKLEAQKYAKISPIPERERRRFIMWATDHFGIYSVGRFAIWKPGLLLDDVFKDIMKIQRMIKSTNYSDRLK